MKQQSFSYHLITLAYIVLALVIFTSCASTRTKEITRVSADTLHYIVTDTTHTVLVRDTLHVIHREEITEHIVTHYDPQTGSPVRQDIDRTILRLADSIAAHYLDSIRSSIGIEAAVFHSDTIHAEQQTAAGTAALTSTQMFAHRFATIMAMAFVILLISIAIRIYLHK